MKHQRAYRFRVYPTLDQAALLSRTFGCVRVVYNQTLRFRTDAWYDRQERVNYNGASARLTVLKKLPEFDWLNEVSSVPLQQCLRNQQKAFTNFFEGRAKYPTFKSKHAHRDSAEFTTSAFRWNQDRQELTLAKMSAPLPIRFSRQVPSNPSTVTVTRDPSGRYHVSMLVEEDIAELPERAETVGLDMGVTTFVTLSTGEKIANPRWQKTELARLAKASRNLARKVKWSNNRRKAAVKVARIHARIADQRRDHHHKLSTRIVRENQTVVIEDLNLRGMVRNRPLARAVSDVGWGEFVRMLEYKAEWYGREIVKIDRWFPSSRRCSECGHIGPKLDLSIRSWICVECGTLHDRDVNAAINIRAAGWAVLACGDGVRPARVKRGKAVVDEAGNSRSNPRIPRL